MARVRITNCATGETTERDETAQETAERLNVKSQHDTFEAAQVTLKLPVADLKTIYETMLAELTTAQNSLGDTPWSGLTQAQKVERLRTIQQGQLAHEEKILKALNYLVRRAIGE